MISFYLIALIPIAVGGLLWANYKEIIWQEWVASSVFALVFAGVFHFFAIRGMTSDVETFSGRITTARYVQRWKEYYEYAVYRNETVQSTYTDSKGFRHTTTSTRLVFDHWEPTSRWHEEYWECFSDINTSYRIDKDKFNYFVKNFGNVSEVPGVRKTSEHNSRMIAGFPNDYITRAGAVIEPITDLRSWENKVKAAPSVFSFSKIPTNVSVYPWPRNEYPFRSGRVLGTAQAVIDTFEWDKLNAVLGPTKLVNLIIIGFRSEDSILGHYQQAKFIGGKKNDLVITFGGDLTKPAWVYTFGWTEKELVKKNIDSYILKNGVTTNLYSFLLKEVIQNYNIKDWSKFDYLSVEPQPKHYLWYILCVLATQSGLYIYFHFNKFKKYGSKYW